LRAAASSSSVPPDEEVVDIYDDALNKIGTATRSVAHLKGYWHLNLHVWIVTRRGNGSLVAQVRSDDKPTFAGLIDSTVGGHFRTGEVVSEVAREIEEEIGLEPDVARLVPLGTRLDVTAYHGIKKREIAEVFFARDDRPLKSYRVDPLEVRALVDISIDDGLKLFSGESSAIMVKGTEWGPKTGRRRGVVMTVTKKSFVPKMDSYYMTLFVMARRFLSGDKYLSI
jgi:isopentenyldiphosphate isomerase